MDSARCTTQKASLGSSLDTTQGDRRPQPESFVFVLQLRSPSLADVDGRSRRASTPCVLPRGSALRQSATRPWPMVAPTMRSPCAARWTHSPPGSVNSGPSVDGHRPFQPWLAASAACDNVTAGPRAATRAAGWWSHCTGLIDSIVSIPPNNESRHASPGPYHRRTTVAHHIGAYVHVEGQGALVVGCFDR